MSRYVCTICGYVYDEEKSGRWEDLPDDWKCPVCGAGKSAFRLKEEGAAKSAPVSPAAKAENSAKAESYMGLTAAEISVICSNLARGCEKQYMFAESEAFKKLAEFFGGRTPPAENAAYSRLKELVGRDLNGTFEECKAAAARSGDRGALRALTWSEKVTRIQQALLERYEAEGEAMLADTCVWVCSICGFIYIGDRPPELCPVCKVPAWKFEEVQRRA